MTLHLLVFQRLPPSTTVNSHLIEFPGGQKLSFTAGLSKSVPRTMRLFAEFPEGCVSTGWIRGQEKAWPTKGSRRTLVAGGNPVTGRICLADLCHLPTIIGKTRGIPWPNWAGDLWVLNVININVGSCECQHSEVLLFTASSICDGLGLHSGLY